MDTVRSEQKDELRLKWGTLKGWHLHSAAAIAAGKAYANCGEHTAGCATQRDTDEQKRWLCALIDALNVDEVYLDWDGEYVTKEAAKKYVMEYGKR